MDFQTSFGMGVEYSRHRLFHGEPTHGHPEALGYIEVDMLRAYFSYRYYIDTTNLGTAITYSNPYFTSRFEYWYQGLDYIDQTDIEKKSEGAIGFSLGGGFEFPIKIKESYIGVEALWHTVNFFDKYTDVYQATEGTSGFGYEDLTGDAYTFMVSYVINW